MNNAKGDFSHPKTLYFHFQASKTNNIQTITIINIINSHKYFIIGKKNNTRPRIRNNTNKTDHHKACLR
ncbi:MAG: hypothetical protein WCG25_07505 [bacterium]